MELPPRLHCREVQVEDDFCELTDLIRAAYAPHAATGLRYWATHQTVEDTAKRFAAGHGFVGILDGRVVATVTVQEPDPSSKVPLLAEQGTWSFGQFAVTPLHKGKGFGRQIHEFATAFALQRGCQRMALHTAQPASALVAMYRSWGYAEAGTCDWRPHTNYLSVLMLKVLESRSSQLASLDEVAAVEEAWGIETERRISEIESGAVQAIPIADALAQVRASLK